MKIDEEFKTSDQVLATTLLASNYSISHLDRTDQTGRVKFVFEILDKEAFSDVFNKFHKGEIRLDPRAYAYHFKQLKNRLYS